MNAINQCSRQPFARVWTWSLKFKLPLQPLQQPLHISTIDDRPTDSGTITNWKEPKEYILIDFSMKSFYSLVTVTHCDPLILGLPWMQKYNPIMLWLEREVTRWLPLCHKHCPQLTIISTFIEIPNQHCPIYILEQYHKFRVYSVKPKLSVYLLITPWLCHWPACRYHFT